jgi:hypothetical protein
MLSIALGVDGDATWNFNVIYISITTIITIVLINNPSLCEFNTIVFG